VNPCSIRKRRQNGKIAPSSVVLVVQGIRVAQSVIKEGFLVARVWYLVKAFTDAGPDSRC